MDLVLETVNRHYPDVAPQITRIANSKMDEFRIVQGSIFTIGTHVNVDDDTIIDDMPTRNYDELLTNIRWISSQETLMSIEKVVSDNYPMIVEDAQVIRTSVKDLIKEIFDAYINNKVFALNSNHSTHSKQSYIDKLNVDVLKKIAYYTILLHNPVIDDIVNQIERGILLYTLLIAGVLMKNVTGWYNEDFRTIYHTKANTIVCSLSNYEYSTEIFESMFKFIRRADLNGDGAGNGNLMDISDDEREPEHHLEHEHDDSCYSPIEIAFLKRSQLLPRLFEKIYDDKIKHYQEIGLTDITVDFKDGGQSTVQCHKCKGFYTDYFQLQTRSADEPMTIFYHCRECGNRGRR